VTCPLCSGDCDYIDDWDGRTWLCMEGCGPVKPIPDPVPVMEIEQDYRQYVDCPF
jgi:uncharacterized protein YbaR (Trm112 family)